LIVSTKAVSTLQELVAASGLMEHLLEAILSHDDLEGAGLQQINFDLLGELLKFNRRMFALLDSLLEGRRFDRFVEVRPQRPAASLSLSLSLSTQAALSRQRPPGMRMREETVGRRSPRPRRLRVYPHMESRR
jgi:hypothetical protein